MSEKHTYRDTDYLYASAYIRSVEDRGLSAGLIRRMLEAADYGAALACLLEARSALDGAGDITDAETLCDEFVNDSFRVVSEITTDASVYDFMRYQYDCNNIKTALKCRAKGIDPEGLMFTCGTVPAAEIVKMAEENDFGALPGAFADAAKTAADAYDRTGDPQAIDLPLDTACLAAMTGSANATGDTLLSGAVRLRVDIANVTTVLRVLRMNTTKGQELLERALSPLGSIPKSELTRAYEDGEEAFVDFVKDKLPSGLGQKLSVGIPLSVFERIADDGYLSFVRQAKSTGFGAGVPFLYLTEREYNAKNARIILAGKRSGLSDDEIRDRVRGL